MKNLLFGLIATVMLSFISCAQDITIRTLDPVKDARLINEIENTSDRGIPFPTQSKIIKNNDNSFTIHLPENYLYILQTSKGEVFKYASSGSIKCVCSGGGCSPVAYKDNEYCVMTDCDVCSKTVSVNRNGIIEEVLFLGIYNENESPIKFIVDKFSENDLQKSLETDKAQFNNIIPTLFKLDDFNKSLKDFYAILYNGQIPSFIINNQDIPNNEDYKYAYVSIYGNIGLIPVPSTIELNNLKYASVEAGIVCGCSSGTSCVKGSILGAKYCDAGDCSVCKLSK